MGGWKGEYLKMEGKWIHFSSKKKIMIVSERYRVGAGWEGNGGGGWGGGGNGTGNR